MRARTWTPWSAGARARPRSGASSSCARASAPRPTPTSRCTPCCPGVLARCPWCPLLGLSSPGALVPLVGPLGSQARWPAFKPAAWAWSAPKSLFLAAAPGGVQLLR